MESNRSGFKIRLGLFIAAGFGLFLLGIFIIGRQKNLFNPIFKLRTSFSSVGGLQVGNNVRYGGINVGTVDDIQIINDSTIRVDVMIKKNVERFIKTDCIASIGSEGLIGDRILNISQSNGEGRQVIDGDKIKSSEPVETDAIMSSLSVTANNAEVVSHELGEILTKINNGNGVLGRLIQDTTIAADLSQTMNNLKKSSKGLNENMEAAKHNFLLRGYFNKKKKEEVKAKKEEDKKSEDTKKQNEKSK